MTQAKHARALIQTRHAARQCKEWERRAAIGEFVEKLVGDWKEGERKVRDITGAICKGTDTSALWNDQGRMQVPHPQQ